MPTVLTALPYFPRPTTASFGSTSVTVLPYQVIVWVGIGMATDGEPPQVVRPVPAVLDTGHNHNFVISPAQLRQWAGIDWRSLPLEPGVQLSYRGVPVPHRRAAMWLYANQPGRRDALDLTVRPAHLELDGGLAVYGDGVMVGVAATAQLASPRLPIIGLRALTVNQAVLRIDAARLAVQFDVP